jgi:hypothetical protein
MTAWSQATTRARHAERYTRPVGRDAPRSHLAQESSAAGRVARPLLLVHCDVSEALRRIEFVESRWLQHAVAAERRLKVILDPGRAFGRELDVRLTRVGPPRVDSGLACEVPFPGSSERQRLKLGDELVQRHSVAEHALEDLGTVDTNVVRVVDLPRAYGNVGRRRLVTFRIVLLADGSAVNPNVVRATHHPR